ncbi:hypothetical protein OAA67_00025 [Winogradskyella sp.]|nr:hypothetical protein [Winogradskyella sp.]
MYGKLLLAPKNTKKPELLFLKQHPYIDFEVVFFYSLAALNVYIARILMVRASSSNISTTACGAKTKSGGYCKRKVKGGGRCYQH